MTMEAIGRVPLTDWLMGVGVLISGLVAIVAAWRYADQLGGGLGLALEDGDEGDGPGNRRAPLALPPGPPSGDVIDEELWSIIDAELRRPTKRSAPPRVERIAAHSGRRHGRIRKDRLPGGPTVFPRTRTGGHPHIHATPPKRRSWAGNERGQATFSLLIVVAVVATAVVLLQRTAWHAERINDKAGAIAQSGGGINTASQAVLKLGRTNELAGSILDSAKPLEGKLGEIVRLAKSIDGLATSIDASAVTINSTARGINGAATTILGTARSINDGVAQINANLDTTLSLASAIKTDTGNILTNARAADRELDCIENGALTGGGTVPGPVPC